MAFVVDVFSRRIVGWRQSSSMHTEFVLDALEQALYDRKPSEDDGLIHHSDRGSQYLSIRYSERLAEAGIEPSVGPKGDSYDNALAENHQRALQGRGDSPARAVEDEAGGGTGHAGMGGLVQSPSIDGAAGLRPAGRVQGQLPSTTRWSGRDRLT